MKNLSFFVSAFALCASTSYAAIDCNTLPSCASLGYSDTVAECPKSVNGEEMVIRCPFDAGKPDKEAKGKCIYEAAVGQIGYFTKTLHASSGWLLCDGKSYPYAKYPQLASRIGTQFGGTVNNTFNVPDYRGFFLRVYAEKSTSGYVRSNFSTYAKGDVNNSATVPQKEGLPNITAAWKSSFEDQNTGGTSCSNMKCTQYQTATTAYAMEIPKEAGVGYIQREFSAQLSNPIYGEQSGVTPPNMAVHAYIYAGKIVSQ